MSDRRRFDEVPNTKPLSRANDAKECVKIPLFEEWVWSHASRIAYRRRQIVERMEEMERWPCLTIIVLTAGNTQPAAPCASASRWPA